MSKWNYPCPPQKSPYGSKGTKRSINKSTNQHLKTIRTCFFLYLLFQDGEIAVITPTECSLDKARMEQAPDHGVMTTPDPHPHWTLYEALQQPMAIARALAFGGILLLCKLKQIFGSVGVKGVDWICYTVKTHPAMTKCVNLNIQTTFKIAQPTHG